MNILAVGILAVFLLFAASGWRKGMVRKLAGIVALLVSSFLVSFALPYITEFLKTETPVYQYIVLQCESAVGKQVSSSLLSGGESGGTAVIDREEIKSLLNQYGMDSSMVDSMSDEELQNLVNQYFQEYLNQRSSQESAGLADGTSLTKIEQTKLIQNLPIPNFLKDMLLNYNNSEGYNKLQVTDFNGYIVSFFANIILNILAFVVTLLVVQLVIWTGITALDIFARLPVINFINHLGGLVIGILQGLFAVWLIFLAISMFSATSIGMMLMKMIDSSSILQPMYESNMFLKIIVQAISNFM